MAKAIDIGTSFLVGAELKNGKEVFTIERDAFFVMQKEDFAEEMLHDAGAKYLIKGNHIYIVGEDALKYCMITGKQEHYRRPMKKGVLNPNEDEAVPLLERLIEGIIGKPTFPGEVIAATIPAAPLDMEQDHTFHKVVVERFMKGLGYDVRILNEPSRGSGSASAPA
jgi:actin-like ATPase involved in cell morphogenesis